jgi:hypothetical protein
MKAARPLFALQWPVNGGRRGAFMKPVLTICMSSAFALLAVSCGAGSGPPEPQSQQNPQQDPRETFTGTGVDSNATNAANNIPNITTIVTWKLTQTGANVSGTVTTQSIDPPGPASCNSCHRSRTGALSGTVSGTTLTWTASFPADPANDPTPSCTATLTGTTDIAQGSLGGVYSGQDTCEGIFTSGTLTLAHQPGP